MASPGKGIQLLFKTHHIPFAVRVHPLLLLALVLPSFRSRHAIQAHCGDRALDSPRTGDTAGEVAWACGATFVAATASLAMPSATVVSLTPF